MYIWTSILSLSCLITIAYSVQNYGDLPPGPYCAERSRGCCSGRVDECSAPILGTLCYCDDFCNRTRNEDCCPDFWSFCKGVDEPPETIIMTCHYQGQYFPVGNVAKENCNECKCERMGDKMEMLCEQNVCLVQEDIINTVNQRKDMGGWQAANYSKFWGKTLEEGIKYRLGTLQPHRYVLRMNPVKRIYDLNALPRHFDAEETWPGFVDQVQDQGWCGSSWAISTAAVASDRYGIISKGKEKIKLSAQHLLSCDNRGQQSCNGGYLDRAWQFVRKFGIVNEECFPYVGANEKCRVPRRGKLANAGCKQPKNSARKEYYRTAPPYRLGNETDIMYEIMKSGPVQATMKVYHDFFLYKTGIYRHTAQANLDRTGYHSVRIIGWGEEFTGNGVEKYWRVANSWGPDWGDNGFFKIIRGTNECEIESFVLATWPEIVKERSNDI